MDEFLTETSSIKMKLSIKTFMEDLKLVFTKNLTLGIKIKQRKWDCLFFYTIKVLIQKSNWKNFSSDCPLLV